MRVDRVTNTLNCIDISRAMWLLEKKNFTGGKSSKFGGQTSSSHNTPNHPGMPCFLRTPPLLQRFLSRHLFGSVVCIFVKVVCCFLFPTCQVRVVRFYVSLSSSSSSSFSSSSSSSPPLLRSCAGPQRRSCVCSVPRRTSTAIL